MKILNLENSNPKSSKTESYSRQTQNLETPKHQNRPSADFSGEPAKIGISHTLTRTIFFVSLDVVHDIGEDHLSET